ncbi:MAG: 2-oxoglutarate dehydrogenase E1 component [Gemmatimonadaceae bacterium]|nr:2-oxoglutarate dehydrogenase E1 component [Gemmatimonadaceae bacterium]NUP56243.1 2-oxoglutarate dehydrogenase E1 component [Gemmatimonadaceae bacterium]NUS33156.1 2-oxoglutarate dehydrogenase E1 component [Gemmatimonadaceae bacterium]NUS49114.1 2-oxoglutarate dehydrogenase E1 component [Gemmatimonadaceae bacterium]
MGTFPPSTTIFNDAYIAEAFERYRRDPASVDESWRQYFRAAESLGGGGTAGGVDEGLLRKTAGAAALVEAIRQYGHLAVQLDPLGTPPPGGPELTPEFHGITEDDLALVPASALGFETGTAADVVRHLREVYCGAIGFELTHLGSEAERTWLTQAVERGTYTQPLSGEEKVAVLRRLTEVDGLERFLGRQYQGYKRFSIEGTDALVPMLDEAIVRAAQAGARRVVIGMAHRGRINVLVHVMGMSYDEMFGEFEGRPGETSEDATTGDVKYHLGYEGERVVAEQTVKLELAPNPSHLEVVNPVMSGIARAHQRVAGAVDGRDERVVVPLCIHGDAAFPGEGVVPETFNLSRLRGYRVGGTVHLIVNNQVGFTTDPIDARSTRYASDPAKGFEVPVMHVNADDAEACIAAVRLAAAYRDRFAKDVVIDLVGYRRWGHNETDEPAFTQPKLYELVRAHPTPRQVWAARLVRERVLDEAQVKALDDEVAQKLGAVHKAMKGQAAPASDGQGARAAAAPQSSVAPPAVAAQRLESINTALLTYPSGFTPHRQLAKTLERRRDALGSGKIDWGHAEALAFGALLEDGIGVRLSGQDAERGTFAHRNAVLHDVETGGTYVPLAQLAGARARFEIYNSPLSETAVMGFEYGFSTAAPTDLVLWEAQYGDFVNVAQPIIDQFISADRAKWGQRSGLVLLLPHGYEGGGPEHSSARLERFLQLCAEDNMSVAYPSTPAQYFHILRRQGTHRDRKPLVLMQPKSLLRLPAAASRLEELAGGAFQPVIDDAAVASRRGDVRRLVFSTAKLYYDLLAARGNRAEVALVRVDELYPWPGEALAAVVDAYPNLEDVVWAQEEPKNMGAWTYVAPQLRVATGNMLTIRYVGRPERASPAEGYKEAHDVEQKRIVQDALTPVASGAKRKAARV